MRPSEGGGAGRARALPLAPGRSLGFVTLPRVRIGRPDQGQRPRRLRRVSNPRIRSSGSGGTSWTPNAQTPRAESGPPPAADGPCLRDRRSGRARSISLGILRRFEALTGFQRKPWTPGPRGRFVPQPARLPAAKSVGRTGLARARPRGAAGIGPFPALIGAHADAISSCRWAKAASRGCAPCCSKRR